jgi:epoxyqueuosine reductase
MSQEDGEEEFRAVTRREFLAGVGGFVAGLAALGVGAADPPSVSQAQATPTPQPAVWPCPCTCPCCGENFNTFEMLEVHIAAEHGWKQPRVEQVEQPTYADFLVGRVERFDEKNTVFSRTVWDEAYQALVREAQEKAPGDSLTAQEGGARVSGAIYVDDAVGTLHPNYYGYSGHLKDSGGLYGWEDAVNPTQFPVPDPAQMSAQIKEVAQFYGADLVGICRVDQRWVYSHSFERPTGKHAPLELPYKNAIVMGVEMEWRAIQKSPGWEASAVTALAYSRMAELSASLAKYVRGLGYLAVPSGNDTGQSIPLAIDAGLGELGRNGLLVTPEFGPRQRICKVFTDLTLQPDRPIDFRLRSFCQKCRLCARDCPAGAVRREERTTETTSISNREGILRWPVDVARCYLFWQENGCDCSNCIAACPWGWPMRPWIKGEGA